MKSNLPSDPLAGGAGGKKIGWETLLVAVLLILTFVPFLGENLYTTKGEPREAVIAVSMLDQGNRILPLTFGAEIPYKPPMLAWCIALLGWLNGGVVTEFLSRLPSALAVIVMVVAGFRFFARRTTVNLAVAMALITAGCFEVFRAGTICRVDMLVTMFIVTALYAFYRQWNRHPEGTSKPSLLAALLMSGGVLTKGPVGMLLPCMVVFVFRLMRGNGFRSTVVSVGLSALLSLILPAIWYVAAWQQGGEDFLRLAMEENFGRFTGTMSYESHENPAWYNILTLFYGCAPYTLLLLMSLVCVPRRRGEQPSASRNGGAGFGARLRDWWGRMRAMQPVDLFALLAFVLIFVFYCIPKSKRSVYLLPVYPFAAYFMALYARRLLRRFPRLVRGWCGIICAIGVIASGAVIAVMAGWVDIPASEELQPVVAALKGEGARFRPLTITVFTLLAGLGMARELVFSKIRGCFGWTMIYNLVIYWMVAAAVLPAVMNVKSDRPIAARLDAELPEGEPLYSYRPDPMDRYYIINYYMTDRLRLFDVARPEGEGYVIVSEEDFSGLKWGVGRGYTFTPVLTIKKKSAETGQFLRLMKFRRNNAASAR